MKEGKEIMKTREFLWRKGEKMKVSFEWKKGKMMVLQQFFSWILAKISEYEMETIVEIGQRHEAFKSLQEPTLFCNKICSLKALKSFSHHLV